MTKKLIMKDLFFHFWLDLLEFFWSFKDESIFNKFYFDNSNYWEFYNYKFIKRRVPKYEYKIIFLKDNHSLFAYYKGDKNLEWYIKTKDHITIYSTAFRILDMHEIYSFLNRNFNLKHCRRFDICMDLKIDINELLKYFDEVKTWKEYKKNSNIETRYYWQVKNSLNKRYIIRIYDKIKDIIEKDKCLLYQNYLSEDFVTRVELEIRPELAKNISFERLFEREELIWIYKNYLSKITEIFDSMKGESITLYSDKYKIIDPELYQSNYYKNFKKNIFLWHAKTIYNLWFCPVRVLIWEWYINDKTKISLWIEKIEDFINKEKNAKNKAINNKYFIKNQEKIISNLYKYGKI